MAGAITVTPEQLKSQAKVYQQASAQIEDAIRKVNSMNQTISPQWQGEVFRAYLEQYNQLEGNGIYIFLHKKDIPLLIKH